MSKRWREVRREIEAPAMFGIVVGLEQNRGIRGLVESQCDDVIATFRHQVPRLSAQRLRVSRGATLIFDATRRRLQALVRPP